MPIKMDRSGNRFVEVEVELPGTPEQIWETISTSQGYSAWFVPTDVEGREGGAITFHMGNCVTSAGRVTHWQPAKRLCYEEVGWNGEAPPLATEISIEAKGGKCTLRMVHSLFTDRADWDGELESMTGGWPPHFAILRAYLLHFAGQGAASGRRSIQVANDEPAAWLTLQRALRLEDVQIGDTCEVSTAGVPGVRGTVLYVRHTERSHGVALMLNQPVSGSLLVETYSWGGATHASASLYFYGNAPKEMLDRELPKWESWLQQSLAWTPRADQFTS